MIKEDQMADFKVGYFVGSLAKGSINRKLAQALVRLAPAELQMQEIRFAMLPAPMIEMLMFVLLLTSGVRLNASSFVMQRT